ncbi:DUF222 domain-containing protein [Microbacterium sp. NPDC089189]|uniref:HNH endonuclease signature motif containing protein n=1 Tax=Microbacterium sp. NPDC089189 TaxID=3154972 RepID=UPI003440AD20
MIVECGAPLPRERRSVFEQRALPQCESDTPGRVRTGLRLLAERLHPRTLTERHADARETRAVTVHPTDDGMCELTAILPLILGDAIHDRLTRQAATLQDLRRQAATRLRSTDGTGASANDELLATDNRTMDQLRADLLADMLLTTQPGADPTRTDDGPGTLGTIRAHVQVVVPVLTLTHGSETPADLAGRAPIDADTARRLAGGSCTGWDRILTHPISGQVLTTDRYQPTPDLRRHLRARDAHCRFPGCRVPAIRSEHDHTIDYTLGGHTRLDNLEGLCQRHHSMKQFTGWKVTQLGNGFLAWTSPLGRTYIDEPPPPTVHFTPDINDNPAHPPPF